MIFMGTHSLTEQVGSLIKCHSEMLINTDDILGEKANLKAATNSGRDKV